MTPERWQRIKPLLHSALEREPSERSAFLAAECSGDEALRKDVESLIASHDQAGEFIESPAFEVMAGSLADDQVVGRNLGPYVISARLGAGGMGEVYLAEDTRLGRKVALKMLPASLTTEDERVRRFQQEARAASALNHPNIVTIYEIGEMDSRHFMATEFIEGETLFERLRAGLMKISDALDVAVQVTSALCAAHRAGIVHRDIKPGNIMLRTDGIVKVLDFGLATLTEQKNDDLEAATLVKTKPGIVMGTAHYMSPEQARGQKMDARTDIFSLGVVLYEMLTGSVPFVGQTMTDVLASILMLEPPSLSQSAPEAPEELQRIVHSTLRKDKEERYQTSGELLVDLKALKQELEFEIRSRGYSSRGSGAGAAVAASARPETRYARSGDINIAYQVLGDGPIDLVYVPGWVTNIDYSWEEPSLARYYRRLASFSRLILFDKRGTGLSDQTAKLPTLEQRMDDVRAVMDAVGSERAALFGASEGGNMSILFAATYPERTSALVTLGIFANRIWDPEYPWAPTPEERQKWYDLLEQEWGGVVDLPTLAPSVANDERFRQWWASFLRLSASPGAALALARTNTQIDVRHILPAIRVPTLVLHRTGDLDVKVEEGRFIAARIPGAKFVEFPGRDHLPWVGDQDAILDEVEQFLKNIQHVPELDRVLATVLFTHTVGPTAGSAKLRPHQWRELLERYYQLVRRELEQFRGREIEITENRLLATFDGPARAIRAACGVNDSARLLGIEIKAGLHTGECDVIGDKVGGVAVEIGAQVTAKATSGEILVSSTVKDLVAGSGIQFEDRGAHALKAVEGEWQLFAVKQETVSGPVAKALPSSQTKAGRRSKAIDSLAILPLFNVSSDPNTEYLSDGITESIINSLSQLPKLRVMARSTVFRYKHREIDPQEVGRDLKVRAVMMGRVQQHEERLVISAELVDVADGSQLWGEHYTRELSDIFAVQEEIAKEISEKLRLKLTPAERKRLTKRSTESTEAYQLYLKGRFFWNKRTEEGLRQSIEYFQQAIEKDPGYAAAYAGLSDSYALLALRGLVPAKEAFPKARAAARKALEIDDELGEAYASLAHVRLHEWDWVGLEEEFQRALNLNPGHSIAYPWYAEYLMAIGKADESIAIARQAQEIDPLSPVIKANMAIAFYFARQYDQGIEELRQGLELSPNHFALHFRLGQAYLQKRKYEEAIQEMQKAATLSGRSTENLAGLGQAYAAAGLKEELQQVLDELNDQSKERYVSPYYVAKIYASLGEREQAFTWLEKAYQERNPDFIELKVEPLLDPIRSDARFQDLLRRVGLSTEGHHTAKELPGGPTSSIPLEQEIRFCTTADGVRIAYATVGQGPPLLKAANWLNHLEFDWHSPIWNHLIQEFARDHFLVRYDERGNGLSDWKVPNFTFEAFVQDLASVVDAVGMDRFPIMGISQGGPVAIAYAVRYPERVSHLILYGCYARGWAKRGTPEVSERWEVQKSLIKLGWGQDNPAFRQLWSSLYIPDATPEQWQWFNDLHRICTSPENAFRLLDELGKIDVVDLLKQVKVPTLVLHCRDDFVVPFEEGRRLAGLIPGARFVPLEGRNHLLLESEPAWPKFVTEVRRFLETEQFATKPEWSESTDSIDREANGRQGIVATTSDQAIRTGEIALAPVTSSAEYVAGGIKRYKTAVAAIAAIVVLIIAGLLYSYFRGRGRTIDSLAVLPFLNASGDPNTEYLSDGIAESIIYSTSKLPDLKVTPRSSVVRYKGKEVDPQTVGRDLGVSAVLTGRVIQRGEDLTISAELVDLRDNRVLWGQHYIRKIGDILAVQEEIAREISEKLRLRLTTEDKKQLAKKYTENAEAYQLYLKGRYYWYKRTRDGYQKAIEHFDQAIQKDPSYALAYTGLADCYNVLSSYGIVSPKESFPKGREAALRAREIDASLAEARTSLAYVKYEYDWDFSGAESGFKESIELNPDYATAHQWYALELAGMGRMDEAIREIARAQEIDPTSLIANVNAGWIFYHARQYDRAIEQMRKSLEMDPSFARGHWAISEPLVQKQQYDEAIAELQKARQLDETPIMLALLGHVYAVTGKRSEAQKIIGELTEQSKRMYVDPYFLAQIHTALGDRDKAFEELEKAYQERSSWLVWVKVEPKLDSLRSDPRFTNLVQRIGLP